MTSPDNVEKAKIPWIAFSDRDEYEECISGNRKGLEESQMAISEALSAQAKLVKIELKQADIRGVVLIDKDSREGPRKYTKKDWVLSAISLAGVAIGVIF